MLGQRETITDFQYRYPILFYAILGVFFLLFSRLLWLQVYRGNLYRQISDHNSLKKEKLPGPRGQIFDRNHQVLVDNRLQLDITINPQFAGDVKKVLANLATMADESYERLYKRFRERLKASARFQSITILENAPWDLVVKIESSKVGLAGIDVEPRIRRTYLQQQIGAHLFGYLAKVSERDLEKNSKLGRDYEAGDWIGRSGLERQWESYLRGVDGARLVVVDVHGHRLSQNGQTDSSILHTLEQNVNPKTGNNLFLTIDADLQIAAAESFRGKMGAVVALDPRTGEVLTMLSQPSFDPTEMASKGPELWQSFMQNTYGPLRNKAVQDHFPPGSTFKIFTALAGLEEGFIDKNKSVFCPGFFKFGNRVYHCHKKGGHGVVSLLEAIRGSCDVFFYALAARMGVDPIAKMSANFGLGRRSGIELSHEAPGLVPSEAWKLQTLKQVWTPGESLSVSIGQGYMLTTPLQLAIAYSTLVNGGNIYKPYVVSRIEDAHGKVLRRFAPELISNHKFNPDHLAIVKQGLFEVVNGVGGTAFATGRSKDVHISGKSGTAQVVSLSKEELFAPCKNLPFHKRHLAWFVGYAPSEAPEIVVSVLGLHECGGSAAAAPVVKAVIEKWWQKKQAGAGVAPASTALIRAPMPKVAIAEFPLE